MSNNFVDVFTLEDVITKWVKSTSAQAVGFVRCVV